MADVIRDRIKGLRMVKAGDLLANRHNWRKHSSKQRALVKEMMSRLGLTNAIIARELPDGELEIIDGHLRASIYKSAMIPVLITDLDDREMREVLATYDPIKSLAIVDEDVFTRLMDSIKEDDGFPKTEIASLAGIAEPEPKPSKKREKKEPLEQIASEPVEEAQILCPSCGQHFVRSEGIL